MPNVHYTPRTALHCTALGVRETEAVELVGDLPGVAVAKIGDEQPAKISLYAPY